MTNEFSLIQLLLIVGGVVLSVLLIAAIFIGLIVYYGYRSSRRGHRMPSLQVQVIEESDLPVPVRITMYNDLLDKALKADDFEFAAVLRDKLKNLQQ